MSRKYYKPETKKRRCYQTPAIIEMEKQEAKKEKNSHRLARLGEEDESFYNNQGDII